MDALENDRSKEGKNVNLKSLKKPKASSGQLQRVKTGRPKNNEKMRDKNTKMTKMNLKNDDNK